ncbi:cytochrome C oxidase assembly protein [Ketogulonicigenium robustum]|uniref:Cytochrome c oxidase assembly protein CtaG n=1 Tax=Ketogulonicigenium robustum TaxID=92947 RepID=A0A1W6NXK7_9RHOB|nr:cytochrome c oxidase assembly protein [Ketogulonicigenium robustum]ARO13919.1 cytochrome C oxidase assembly protein [Ketogulonicigenium robustum]
MKKLKDLSPVTRTALSAGGVVILMGSLAWAAVPFYNWFCSVTGYGGTTMLSDKESDVVLDREILVRFTAAVADDMPWRFRPVETEMRMRIGETGLAFYEATNLADHPVAGQAAYNVAPYSAGEFFDKIECFCFTQQVLQPGETVLMPVSFYVDPEIVNHREAKFVNAITLNYTFYENAVPADFLQAGLASQGGEPLTSGAPAAIQN